jgi:hypothetical protein
MGAYFYLMFEVLSPNHLPGWLFPAVRYKAAFEGYFKFGLHWLKGQYLKGQTIFPQPFYKNN